MCPVELASQETLGKYGAGTSSRDEEKHFLVIEEDWVAIVRQKKVGEGKIDLAGA